MDTKKTLHNMWSWNLDPPFSAIHARHIAILAPTPWFPGPKKSSVTMEDFYQKYIDIFHGAEANFMPICTSGPDTTAQSTAYAATVAAAGTQSGAHYCAQHRHQPPLVISQHQHQPSPSNSPASAQYYSPPVSSTSALKPAPKSVFLWMHG